MRTLAVFAKEPKPGRVKTRLAATIGATAACLLYRAFVRDLARTLASARDLRVEWWVDGDARVLAEEIDLALSGPVAPAMEYFRQPARDLGGRMGQAFEDIFARQRSPVALIGTDCPLIDLHHIENLFAAVEAGADAALIPVDDGGYVGLALARPAPEAFAGIPWSTPAVLKRTVEALRGAGRSVQVLATLYDVDTGRDLARLAKDLRSDPAAAAETARVVQEMLPARDVGQAKRGMHSTRTEIPMTATRPPRTHVVDALGRPVPVDPPARRILSLVPSVTECLFDLGVGQRIVGRTDYCISPPDAVASLPSVGGPKSVDLDLVAGLEPDLVLANAEENARDQVEALIESGLRVHVTFPRTLEDAARFLEDLGELVRTEEPAATLAGRVRRLAAQAPEPAVPAACLIWKDPFMTASSDTLTSAILEAGGARNVFADRPDRYPQISPADIAAARPRLILLPTEPYEFTESDAREIRSLAPGAATAMIQGEWVTWYGSRMEEAIEGLRRLIDPFRKTGGDQTQASTEVRREP